MRFRVVCLLSLVCAASASAQVSDSVQFTRARQLVSDGNGALGRALVDTILAAAAPGTPAYAEALYWRATLAERASEAERDYRQLAVEYPTSPRAADALVRLAQLDLVRGQPAVARDHLARLLRDHSDAPTRARAHYWLARAALDGGDARAACEALSDAAGETEPGGDLARQVVALRARVPRCTLKVAVGGGAAVTPAAGAPPSAPAPSPVPVPSPAAPARVATVAPTTAGAFTVQISAYDSRSGADALAARLVQRGLEARVTTGGGPDTPPFRVRIGRFATRAEAAAAQKALKGKGLAGFITVETVSSAEGRP